VTGPREDRRLVEESAHRVSQMPRGQRGGDPRQEFGLVGGPRLERLRHQVRRVERLPDQSIGERVEDPRLRLQGGDDAGS
jgi:hypothetical protein